MEVLNRPEAGDGSPEAGKPPKTLMREEIPLTGGGGWWVKGKETKIGFFAGRFVFVVVGAMFIIMTLISLFMVWVSWNEPYLTPSIVDETLHENKIYLQYEGETVYHELAMGNQPANLIADEVTQISSGRVFKLVFTPKQLDIPEHYKIYLKDTGKETDGGMLRQSKYLKQTVDGPFYTLTVAPANGKWQPGNYEINIPDAGMFGGEWFAYFTITN